MFSEDEVLTLAFGTGFAGNGEILTGSTGGGDNPFCIGFGSVKKGATFTGSGGGEPLDSHKVIRP